MKRERKIISPKFVSLEKATAMSISSSIGPSLRQSSLLNIIISVRINYLSSQMNYVNTTIQYCQEPCIILEMNLQMSIFQTCLSKYFPTQTDWRGYQMDNIEQRKYILYKGIKNGSMLIKHQEFQIQECGRRMSRGTGTC